MPVAGQDAVADASSVQRKAHVRAAIVDGVCVAFVIKDGHCMPGARNHHAARSFSVSSEPTLIRPTTDVAMISPPKPAELIGLPMEWAFVRALSSGEWITLPADLPPSTI